MGCSGVVALVEKLHSFRGGSSFLGNGRCSSGTRIGPHSFSSDSFIERVLTAAAIPSSAALPATVTQVAADPDKQSSGGAGGGDF